MKIQDLFEMPYLMDSDVDFGLPYDKLNRRRLELLMHRNPQTLEIYKSGTLYGLEDTIFFVTQGRNLIDYFMQYIKFNHPIFGNLATQVKLWRRSGLGVKGLTGVVFYDHMLRNFDTMISDRVQSDDGRRFWIDRMGESYLDGKLVAIIDNQDVKIMDSTVGLENWLSMVDGWGKMITHRERRFVISNLSEDFLKNKITGLNGI